jgi:hypothetical protein
LTSGGCARAPDEVFETEAAEDVMMTSFVSLAKKEKQFLETLKELVSIETSSREIEGLDRLSSLIAGRLTSSRKCRNASRIAPTRV